MRRLLTYLHKCKDIPPEFGVLVLTNLRSKDKNDQIYKQIERKLNDDDTRFVIICCQKKKDILGDSPLEIIRGNDRRFTFELERISYRIYEGSHKLKYGNLYLRKSNIGSNCIPRTGQTTSYCPGDDGDIQAGKPWPRLRFLDNGDGTITDKLTGLVWFRNSQCFNTLDWQSALEAVSELNSNPASCKWEDYTGSYTDWRLPNINELSSLIHCGERSTSTWLKNRGFSYIGGHTWTSTTSARDTNQAWLVHFIVGFTSEVPKETNLPILPVRGTTNGSTPVRQTGQTTTYYSGDDGDLQAGMELPTERFQDNGDGTITDLLTGLIWLQNANCIKTDYPDLEPDGAASRGGVIWENALDFVAGMNDGRYSRVNCEHTDWRLPNRRELESMTDYSRYNKSLHADAERVFDNVDEYYWSSTPNAYYIDQIFHLYVSRGEISQWCDRFKNRFLIWPVRGGELR